MVWAVVVVVVGGGVCGQQNYLLLRRSKLESCWRQNLLYKNSKWIIKEAKVGLDLAGRLKSRKFQNMFTACFVDMTYVFYDYANRNETRGNCI